MISQRFYFIPWKEASLIAPQQLCEHIINHSIRTTHQSILMPALIIDSGDDNPLIVSCCWESGFGDNLIQMAFEAFRICAASLRESCGPAAEIWSHEYRFTTGPRTGRKMEGGGPRLHTRSRNKEEQRLQVAVMISYRPWIIAALKTRPPAGWK